MLKFHNHAIALCSGRPWYVLGTEYFNTRFSLYFSTPKIYLAHTSASTPSAVEPMLPLQLAISEKKHKSRFPDMSDASAVHRVPQ